jgi:hypothetical protein
VELRISVHDKLGGIGDRRMGEIGWFGGLLHLVVIFFIDLLVHNYAHRCPPVRQGNTPGTTRG